MPPTWHGNAGSRSFIEGEASLRMGGKGDRRGSQRLGNRPGRAITGAPLASENRLPGEIGMKEQIKTAKGAIKRTKSRS